MLSKAPFAIVGAILGILAGGLLGKFTPVDMPFAILVFGIGGMLMGGIFAPEPKDTKD